MRPSEVLVEIGRPVAFYSRLVPVAGGVDPCLLLCQLLYWTGKQRDGDGWIVKTQIELEEETGLGRREQETSRRKLRERDLIEEKRRGRTGKLRFRIKFDVLDELWADTVGKRQSKPENGGNEHSPMADSASPLPSSSETTTETTNARRRPKRQPNPLWDALVEVMGYQPQTKPEREMFGSAVKELKAIDATPEQVLARSAEYHRRFRGYTLTPRALLKHWSALATSDEPIREEHRPLPRR